jgi:hypothetical protein
MITENNKLFKDLSLQNKALSAAVGRLLREKEEREEECKKAVRLGSESGNESTGNKSGVQHPTPEKKRTSKKSSSELMIERTPPKPPEGTPQRKKKKKVSESPLSASNRFELLRSENSDDEEPSADAEDIDIIDKIDITTTTDLDPVSVPGETAVQDDDQATAIPSPPSSNQSSPGSGSNGVGRLK